MASRPRPVEHTITTAAGTQSIWGDPEKLALFFPSAAPKALVDLPPKTSTVRSTTVRRYPGDPNPFTRKSYSRTVRPAGARTNGTTPGRRMWCELRAPKVGGGTAITSYQFTFTGPFTALRLKAESDAPSDFTIRNASGVAYDIKTTP
jgi:hypothetical protein